MHTGKKAIAFTFIMVLCITGLAVAHTPACKKTAQTKTLAQSNNAFTAKLFQQLRTAEGNLFFSPYSIRTSLAMTYAGARGRTAEQMKSALNFTLNTGDLHKAFADSINTLNNRGGDNYEMNIANSLWSDITCRFQQPFIETIKGAYNSAPRKVDFLNVPESARLKINAWVEEQTQEKIENLIPPGGVNNNTRLALVNAVYFKGIWNKQFDKKLTRDETFFHADGSTIKTPLMSLSKPANLPFFAGDGIKIIELNYRGDDISMVIILPDKADGLADLEAQFNEFQLNRWLTSLEKEMVKVFLPRFSMHWGAKNLVPDLRQLGMKDAFVTKVANFSAIDGTRDLVISSVFHKAFVDVNEEGTEAAAASGAIMGVTSMPPPPEIFRADRPFLFLIREKLTGNILFMGRLTEPVSN